MTTHTYYLAGILLLSALIILTRIIPFVFSKQLKQSQHIQAVAQHLPTSILLLVVIYEIEPANLITPPHGVYEIIGLAIVTVVHLWRRNVLLSLGIGTAAYILLKYGL